MALPCCGTFRKIYHFVQQQGRAFRYKSSSRKRRDCGLSASHERSELAKQSLTQTRVKINNIKELFILFPALIKQRRFVSQHTNPAH